MARNTQSRLSHPEGDLCRRTRELLVACSINRLEIYKATDIAPNWLWAFAKGNIPDPSVNRIECLYNYLSTTPLEVK